MIRPSHLNRTFVPDESQKNLAGFCLSPHGNEKHGRRDQARDDRKLNVTGCNPQFEIYNLNLRGVLAQLVERLNGIEEVRGSNPLGSTQHGAPTAIARQKDGCQLRIRTVTIA